MNLKINLKSAVAHILCATMTKASFLRVFAGYGKVCIESGIKDYGVCTAPGYGH